MQWKTDTLPPLAWWLVPLMATGCIIVGVVIVLNEAGVLRWMAQWAEYLP